MREKIRILYVDDEVRNVTSFKRSFRRVYDIDTATSAREGIELLKTNTYEIILTDQRMPEMTGVEFLTEICDLLSGFHAHFDHGLHGYWSGDRSDQQGKGI